MKKKKCKVCQAEYPMDSYRQRQEEYKIFRSEICKNCEDKVD
tara:strand:- start:256 stop:381 length:126 start_codon:yes stop_codon:yes gene_type:complete